MSLKPKVTFRSEAAPESGRSTMMPVVSWLVDVNPSETVLRKRVLEVADRCSSLWMRVVRQEWLFEWQEFKGGLDRSRILFRVAEVQRYFRPAQRTGVIGNWWVKEGKKRRYACDCLPIRPQPHHNRGPAFPCDSIGGSPARAQGVT